ncbi:hypothetical protein NQ317_014867 [Molorchus minor]|uniref:Tyr recombinase domain-containing protein n=1 Tax=Molorchus minor TaxID=1323400 RepID=A0ABQ9JSE4_9CUCU|nr:hypothetical protein NQ317_014867 [Molorchus minor]
MLTATLNIVTKALASSFYLIQFFKSRNLYDKAYNQFREWCKRKKVQTYTENVMLAYLHEISNEYKSSTIALIFGISGACLGYEITNLRVDDIEVVVSSLIITIPTKISRTFVVTRTEGNTNLLDLYRKYATLRPPHTSHGRFFVFYKSGKCTTQPVGKNTFGKIPSIIATYLGLSDPTLYTGHCLRRSSATLLLTRADITTIKRHGGWKSTTVAEGYIDNSVQNKTNIANQVLQAATTVKKTINLSKENVSFSEVPSNINFNSCENVTFTINVNKQELHFV